MKATQPGVAASGGAAASLDRAEWSDRAVLVLAAVLTPLPFLANLASFRELVWFGDDIHLLAELEAQGFRTWIVTNFAESFAPAFKLVWGGTVLLGDGRYIVTIAVCWIVHVLNVVLLGRVLLGSGFGRGTTLAAIATFGLAWPHIETLGWACQLSPLMSTAFLLLAWGALLDVWHRRDAGRSVATYLIGITLSALSFARGVLSGIVLAAAMVVRPFLARGASAPRWLVAASFVPAIFSAAFIMSQGSGNHRHFAGDAGDVLSQVALWGGTYLLANPFFQLLRLATVEPPTVLLLGVVKLAIVALAFRAARGRPDTLLALGVLTCLDLANAVLLGIGRYHTGLQAAAGWRYQYGALLSFAPIGALAVAHPFRGRGRVGQTVAVAALGGWLFWIAQPWTLQAARWAEWRGTAGRRVLLAPTDEAAAALPPWVGIPGHVGLTESRRIVRTFHLR